MLIAQQPATRFLKLFQKFSVVLFLVLLSPLSNISLEVK